MKSLKFRVVKITAGMTTEFEILATNAPDHIIKLQLMYISALEEEGKIVPEDPYWIIKEFGYDYCCLGCQDNFDYEDDEELENSIDIEFDYYEL